MIWSNNRSEYDVISHANFFTKILWDTLSWNLMLWFAVLIVFLITLVVVPSARENTLRHIANLKERDEREEYITGKAARAAYISTLSLTLFLLFFSMFTLSIYRVPKDELHKRNITVTIHVGANFLETPQPEFKIPGEVIFATKNIMLSSSSMIIILLAWQLLIFNYTARKEQKIGLD